MQSNFLKKHTPNASMVKAIKKSIDGTSFNMIVLSHPTKICILDSFPHVIGVF